MPVVTSRHHPIVKAFRDVTRGGGPLLLLDGWHLVAEAAACGLALDTIALHGTPTPEHQRLLERVQAPHTRTIDVSTSVMSALSPVKSPTGIVGAARRPVVDARTVLQPSPALILAAAGIQDPGNVGAVVRSAAAAGATGVVLDSASADPWGWKALRASMGSAFHLPVVRGEDLDASIAGWRAAGVSIVAAVPRGGVSMYDVDLSRPVAILLGGEGAGLPDAFVSEADTRVSIPMRGDVESLNVAVAAALLLYETQRQRT